MNNHHVQRMLDTIQRDYTGVVTLHTLAAAIGRQPAYLGRLFRHEVGSSVREYLTRVRLDHASELILGGVKIEAVALSVGYRSKKNFYEQFRRRYGTTPVPYRCQWSAGAPPDGARDENARPETAGAVFTGRRELAAASDAPRYRSPQREQLAPTPPESEPEPVLGRLGSILRASRKAWRLAVRAQQIMLDHFTDSRVAMLLTDDGGRYVAANPAAMSVTGYSVPELACLSPTDLFPEAPDLDTRCVWQLVLCTVDRTDRSPNAVIRAKTGNRNRVYMATLKNMLWGRREMSELLDQLRPAARSSTRTTSVGSPDPAFVPVTSTSSPNELRWTTR